MFIERIRSSVLLKSVFMLFVLISLATVIRPMLVNQSAMFTYIGIFNSSVMGALFVYLKYATPKPWQPMLFIVVNLLLLTSIALVSGGVNSQFAYLFPILPMFMSLVSASRYTVLTTVLIIIIVAGMYFNFSVGGLFPDFTSEEVSSSKTAARAFWLVMSVFMSTAFGLEYSRLISSLGDKLSYEAEIDALTGLQNRRSVMTFLQSAIVEVGVSESALSVMMIDVDNFKKINDDHGHLVGDNCLMNVATSIKSCVRNKVDLAGRYGGEEFIVVIKEIDNIKATEIAQKIRFAIERGKVEIEGSESIGLTVTIGLCTLNGAAIKSVEQMVNLADDALYRGKKSGKNCVIQANIK